MIYYCLKYYKLNILHGKMQIKTKLREARNGGFVEVSQKEMMEVDGGGKAVSAVTAVVCAAAAKVCFGAAATGIF